MQKLNEIRWGMIGCGNVTEIKSAPAFNQIPGSRLVAVMSRTESRVRDYAARHKVPQWHTDARALVENPEVNAVYIATPPSSHPEYTFMAASAGKPIYVEKPMACKHADCLRMIEACEKAGAPLFVAYYRRRLPKFLKVKELLEARVIGDVRHVSINLTRPPQPGDTSSQMPWRVQPEISGGGYFYDLAPHQLDIMDYFFGPIVEASGRCANQAGWYSVEDIVCSHFRFGNGVLGTGTWCFSVNLNKPLDRIEILGSDGLMTFATFDGSPITLRTSSGVKEYDTLCPNPIQMPLIETIVAELQGESQCPSTGVTAARTNKVMEQIVQPA
jgi:predicted dehydrogenase